jgi:hypothetical protein
MFCEFTCPFRPWNTKRYESGISYWWSPPQVILRWTVSFRPAVLRACWIQQGTPSGLTGSVLACCARCARELNMLDTRAPKLWSEAFGGLFVYWKLTGNGKVSKGIQDFKAVPCRQAGTILLLRNSLARNWFRCVATDATPVMLTVVVWGPFSWMLRERTAD